VCTCPQKIINPVTIFYPNLIPNRVRVSIGTASVLGLLNYRLNVPPTTAYIMSYTENRCTANCSFCAQAREHNVDKKLLSRVIWPDFTLKAVLNGFDNPKMDLLERVCLQVVNYPGFEKDTINLVRLFNEKIRLPLSVDICPVSLEALRRLKEAGVERISIPLDGATKEIFDQVKGKDVNGPYRWGNHFKSLREAVNIFGPGNVGSNIIIGLGESEMEVMTLIQKLHDMQVIPVLFAFTPIKGTKLEHLHQPSLESYRRLQVAQYLITRKIIHIDSVSFDKEGKIIDFGDIDLLEALKNGDAFRTTGCPGCNRPFYNERPSGPFYNYPRPLNQKEIEKELKLIRVDKID
jgi:biotin synthase